MLLVFVDGPLSPMFGKDKMATVRKLMRGSVPSWS